MSEKELLLRHEEPPTSKSYQRHEYIISFCAILILVGIYFSQDEPQALQVPLKNEPFNLTGAQFNFIYFITNFPIVLFSILGGIIIDRVGVKKAGIIFALVIFLAQSLVTFSLYWKVSDFYDGSSGWYVLLLVARGVFGISGETLHIVQAAMLSVVVPAQHISTVLGLCLSVPLLFTSLNSLVSTEVYDALDSPTKLYVPFALGAVTCLISFVGMIGTALYFARITRKNQFVQATAEDEPASEKIDCKQIKQLGSTFWLILLIGFALPGSWYGFLDNVVECFHERFGLSIPTAGKLVMIPYIVCALGCPLYGYLANRFQNRRKLLILFVPTIAVLAHIIVFLMPHTAEADAFTYIFISLGLLVLGLAFSGYVSIVVPSISLVVDENIIGTAFGLLGMANAVSQSIFPMISSMIIQRWSISEDDLSEGYKINSLLFICACLLALVAGFALLLSRNRKARELDNEQKYEQWDGDFQDHEIDELFASRLISVNEVRASEESDFVMKISD